MITSPIVYRVFCILCRSRFSCFLLLFFSVENNRRFMHCASAEWIYIYIYSDTFVKKLEMGVYRSHHTIGLSVDLSSKLLPQFVQTADKLSTHDQHRVWMCKTFFHVLGLQMSYVPLDECVMGMRWGQWPMTFFNYSITKKTDTMHTHMLAVQLAQRITQASHHCGSCSFPTINIWDGLWSKGGSVRWVFPGYSSFSP